MIKTIKKYLWKKKVEKARDKFIEHELKYPNPDSGVAAEICNNFIKALENEDLK